MVRHGKLAWKSKMRLEPLANLTKMALSLALILGLLGVPGMDLPAIAGRANDETHVLGDGPYVKVVEERWGPNEHAKIAMATRGIPVFLELFGDALVIRDFSPTADHPIRIVEWQADGAVRSDSHIYKYLGAVDGRQDAEVRISIRPGGEYLLTVDDFAALHRTQTGSYDADSAWVRRVSLPARAIDDPMLPPGEKTVVPPGPDSPIDLCEQQGNDVPYRWVVSDADIEFWNNEGSSWTLVQDDLLSTIRQTYVDASCVFLYDALHALDSCGCLYTSTNGEILLNQVTAHWATGHESVERDLVYLTTGKDLDLGLAGVAHSGGCCYPESSVSVALGEVRSPIIWRDSTIQAHEIGHLFTGAHEEAVRETETTTMCPAGGVIECSILSDMLVGPPEQESYFTNDNANLIFNRGHRSS